MGIKNLKFTGKVKIETKKNFHKKYPLTIEDVKNSFDTLSDKDDSAYMEKMKSEYFQNFRKQMNRLSRYDIKTKMHVAQVPKPRDIKSLVDENLSRFQLNLYLNRIDIGQSREQSLRDKQLIDVANFIKREDRDLGGSNYRVFDSVANTEFYDSLFSEGSFLREQEVRELEEIIRTKFSRDYSFDNQIPSSAWKLEGGNSDYEPAFWEWINTLNGGWQYYDTFEKFELYKEQARRWLSEDYIFDSQAPEDAQVSWLKLEFERMRQNSLYGCNKYLWMKDDFATSPKGTKYAAWKAQSFIFYLYDLYINCIIGKPRQIGFTTGIVGAGIIRTMTRRNFFCKMVATKGEKTEEIFRDKAKYALSEFPSYITPTVGSDTGSQLWFVKKLGKGKTSGGNSMFKVEAPSVYCINGGSPSQVFCDEIGTYDIFGDMLREGRPALYRTDPITGELKMQRHMMAWGTGGNMEKGGAAMEIEYRSCKEAWLDRDFGYGICPVFLNSFAKTGFTKKFYESEKRYYYSKEHKIGEADPKVQFHQAYPVVEDDMFLISSDTLIPTTTINDMIIKSRRDEKKGREKGRNFLYGYFLPIFDTTKPMPEDFDLPFLPIGAKFVPANDQQVYENSPLACACVAHFPDLEWEHRYFQGTDPIISSSGTSNMSSVVWDKLENRPSAWVDGKTDDYRFMYLQCHLMNLYFSRLKVNRAKGIPELIEANVGGEYMNYKKDRGYANTILPNFRIYSDVLKTKSIKWGLRKGHNTPFLITELEEMIILHIEKIKCAVFWEQMKTFTRKKTTKIISYEPQNKDFHRDDLIDGMYYAHICAKSEKVSPRKVVSIREAEKKKVRYGYDENWNLVIKKGNKPVPYGQRTA